MPHLVFLPLRTPRTIPIDRVVSVLSEKILEKWLKVEGFLRAVLVWLCDKTRDLYPGLYHRRRSRQDSTDRLNVFTHF